MTQFHCAAELHAFTALHPRLRLMVLSACLVAAQWFAVLHAVDHTVESLDGHSDHGCFSCAVADQLGNGVAATALVVHGIFTSDVFLPRQPDGRTVELARKYFARGPPGSPLA